MRLEVDRWGKISEEVMKFRRKFVKGKLFRPKKLRMLSLITIFLKLNMK